MAIAKITTADTELEWLELHEAGRSLREIGELSGVSHQRVHQGIARARARPRGQSLPRLKPIYGSSCKALKVLKCRDVHPCGKCRGEGVIYMDAPTRERINQEGENGDETRGNVLTSSPCDVCAGNGLGTIPKGSECMCAVCSKSGHDHRSILRPWPLPEPEPRKKYSPASDGLRGGKR